MFSALEARQWSELRLAKDAGVARSVISAHLSGTRKIQPPHLMKYLRVLNHQERPQMLAAWLRDVLEPDQVADVLNASGDDLNLDVKKWTPPLPDATTGMLAWWAREMARDGELAELFKLLSAKAGYHPARTVAGPVKRRRR
jgi:hypothetical protein